MQHRSLHYTGVILLVLLAAAAATQLLQAQEISEKQEVAVFRLSYYDYDIPNSALGSIDEEIKAVFINIGRFDVIGMTYRLSLDDVNAFIDRIKEYKQEQAEIPEQFQMGYEVFTERDMNRLIGTFYVVIPAVTFFSVERDRDGDYSAQLKVSFSVINVEEATTFAQFFVETSGTSEESGERAAQRAIGKIPVYLEYELTKIPEFTLKSAVLERRGGEVVLELGRNMGIRRGFEFIVITPRVLASGRLFEEETGLVIVKDVGEEVSLGTVLYGSPREGDQLEEVPRVGFELMPYFNVLLAPGEQWDFYYVAGLKATLGRGFYDFRPFFGIETPLPIGPEDSVLPFLWVAGLPLTAYIGGEAAFYWGRLQISPQVAVGVTTIIPWWVELDRPVVSHIGGYVGSNFSFLLNKNLKLSLDAGYKHYFGIWDVILKYITDKTSSYGGIMLGAGLTIKF